MCAAALALAAAGAHAAGYTIRDLGDNRIVTGMAPQGEGLCGTMATARIPLRAERGHMRRLDSHGLPAQACAISVHDAVAGTLFDGVQALPAVWTRSGGLFRVQLPRTPAQAHAYGIRGSGAFGAADVVGQFSLAGSQADHCFLYQSFGPSTTDPGTLLQGDSCIAYGVDRDRRVVGTAHVAPGGEGHAFVWQDNEFT